MNEWDLINPRRSMTKYHETTSQITAVRDTKGVSTTPLCQWWKSTPPTLWWGPGTINVLILTIQWYISTKDQPLILKTQPPTLTDPYRPLQTLMHWMSGDEILNSDWPTDDHLLQSTSVSVYQKNIDNESILFSIIDSALSHKCIKDLNYWTSFH